MLAQSGRTARSVVALGARMTEDPASPRHTVKFWSDPDLVLEEEEIIDSREIEAATRVYREVWLNDYQSRWLPKLIEDACEPPREPKTGSMKPKFGSIRRTASGTHRA